MNRWVSRLAAVLVGLVGALAIGSAAFAHVEVEAEPDTAGATNAVLTFTAEAESTTAGIVSVQIVLPTTITPSDVTLKTAPTGWTLTPAANGYTVAGPALPKGKNAVHSVTVSRLPDTPKLVFKALVSYSDGQVDRWIEEPTTANPTPESPTPILTLKANPSPAVTTPAPTAAATTTTGAATSNASGGSNSWISWVVAAAVVLAIVIAIVARRRSSVSR